MKKRIVILTILGVLLLSGCGKTITYPEEFTKNAMEENGNAGKVVRAPKVWIGLSGSEAPYAEGNYPDLGILVADTAGTKAGILLAGPDGKWKTVSREVMEASIGNRENYHISSSVTELLASGELALDMRGLNVMLLDLDPNLSNSAADYGNSFNRLLKSRAGSALSIRTVPCAYDGDLTVSLEDNNRVRSEVIKGITKRNVVVLVIGPEVEVTDFMNRFEENVVDEKLQITSRYDVYTDEESANTTLELLPKGYLNDTEDSLGLGECDCSYNLSKVAASDEEAYAELDDSVEVLEYTGGCMEEGWIHRMYLSGVSDPENYTIYDVSVQECMDDGTWEPVDSGFLNARIESVSTDTGTMYCLSFGEEDALSGDYAVTIQFCHSGADQNSSVNNASASTMEYIKALDSGKPATFEKLMSYELFTTAAGEDMYPVSDRVCGKAEFLIINN